MAGYITIKKTEYEKMTIDNRFKTIAVLNYASGEIRSITVDNLFNIIKEFGLPGQLSSCKYRYSKKAPRLSQFNQEILS